MPQESEQQQINSAASTLSKSPSTDLTRATNSFEFWPAWTLQIPMYLAGFYWGIRLGKINFFPAVNPCMENGGLFNYSKHASFQGIKSSNLPKSIRLSPPNDVDAVLQQANFLDIDFPFILKPDQGERGRGVELLNSEKELISYLEKFQNEDLILQEYISGSYEYGVFLVRNLKTGLLDVTSITQKIPLQVQGDGVSNVYQLAKEHPRARRYLSEIPTSKIDLIPTKGEITVLSTKGNHCKGATFAERNHLLSEGVTMAFREICSDLSGFHYGRLDIKVQNPKELSQAQSIKILEINGANSEPIHIYDSRATFLQACQEIAKYFSKMGEIAKINLQTLHPQPTFASLYRNLKNYKSRMRNAEQR